MSGNISIWQFINAQNIIPIPVIILFGDHTTSPIAGPTTQPHKPVRTFIAGDNGATILRAGGIGQGAAQYVPTKCEAPAAPANGLQKVGLGEQSVAGVSRVVNKEIEVWMAKKTYVSLGGIMYLPPSGFSGFLMALLEGTLFSSSLREFGGKRGAKFAARIFRAMLDFAGMANWDRG